MGTGEYRETAPLLIGLGTEVDMGPGAPLLLMVRPLALSHVGMVLHNGVRGRLSRSIFGNSRKDGGDEYAQFRDVLNI